MTSQSRFLEIVPDGWFKDYLHLMRDFENEMPLPFHFLSTAAVLGNLIGLRCWAMLNKGVRVYPNVNALLLSPAGQCRRGEGTKFAVRLARLAGANVMSGKTTPEGLKDELLEKGNVLLYAEELSQLLTKQDFQRSMIPELTKLLLHGEGPADMRTRTMAKRVTIPYVNLSAIFTSAPDWFVTTIPEEAFGGGLMSRFLVCYLEQRHVFKIDLMAEDSKTWNELDEMAVGLQHAANVLEGRVQGTVEAQRWLDEWYRANEVEVVDERMAPHRNRKPANLLRLALLLAAAAAEATLTRDRLEHALDILNYLEPTVLRLYGDAELLSSATHKGEKRILQWLYKHGGQDTHGRLSQACLSYFDNGGKEMRTCLEGLMEKSLVIPSYKNGVARWPPLMWQLTKLPGKEGEVDA